MEKVTIRDGKIDEVKQAVCDFYNEEILSAMQSRLRRHADVCCSNDDVSEAFRLERAANLIRDALTILTEEKQDGQAIRS